MTGLYTALQLKGQVQEDNNRDWTFHMPASTMRNPSNSSGPAKAAIFAAALTFWAGSSLAQTATDSFDVTITIQDDCEITSTQTLDFGSTGVLTANVDATAALEVTCTAGTNYNIGLDEGTGGGASIATRFMTSVASDLIGYQLYRDMGRTLIWGDTIGGNTVSSTGTGNAQDFPVYGRVPVQTTPPTGTYTDTVTVTVTF